MNQKDKLLRDIETLRESMRRDWKDLATLQLSIEDRAGIKQHIAWCQNELKELLSKLG